MIVRHINNNMVWKLLSFLPKAVFLTMIMVIFLVSWLNEGGLLHLAMPCWAKLALHFGTHTELQNRKTFAKKDLAFKNYSVLTLCSLFHFPCSLVTEEVSFLLVTLNQNWVNLTLGTTSQFQERVKVLHYFSRNGTCRSYLPPQSLKYPFPTPHYPN